MGWFLHKLFRIGFIFLVALIVLLILFRVKFGDAILSLAQTKVRNATSDLINDSIDTQIDL